jgi:hypothetical protein
MKNFKELSLSHKVGLVVCSVCYAGCMTYCIKEIKKNIDETKALSEMIAHNAQQIKDSLY